MINLKEIDLKIEQLFLDPNNPRYADIAEIANPVPDEKVSDERVQKRALERILDQRLEVQQLMDSIGKIGFLTVDRLVVVPLPDPGKYKVIEGNRRLGAIKSLLDNLDAGEVDIADEILPTLKQLPVLVLDEADKEKCEHIGRVLQGVRHVSSIRAWGPYQQAQLVVMMINQGRERSEVKEILGLPGKRMYTLIRCYYALKQMKDDSDYGEFANPKRFTYFDEIFKLPKLYKDWLKWDDYNCLFTEEHNRKLLYSFIAGEEVDGERKEPRIPDPKDLRCLPALMEDAMQFNRFCETPGLSLDDALKGVVTRSQIDWRGILSTNLNALSQLPANDLKDASDNDVALIEKVKDICTEFIRMVKAFKGSQQ
jgi:ParB-like nuclease domain